MIFFVIELEKAIKSVFTTRDFSEPSSAKKFTIESEIVRSMVIAFANKIYIQRYIKDEVKNI